MIRVLSVLLITSLGFYWYATVGIVCQAPLSYEIVALDERFNLSMEEALAATAAAETLWEEAAGRELFYHAPAGQNPEVRISFVFDDRQEKIIAEEVLRESLDQKENTTESLNSEYETLVTEYDADKAKLDAAIEAYERDLASYNSRVASYNSEGGAPPAVFRELAAEERRLGREMVRLNRATDALNAKAAEINRIGEEGNRLIEQYNRTVETYNTAFGEPDEFTQGDYQAGEIQIYTFVDTNELINVLAHEFGHALDIDHVEGSASVMYYLMADQPNPPALSTYDTAALVTQCGETGTLGTTIRSFIHRYL